jgi:hypothetical protein
LRTVSPKLDRPGTPVGTGRSGRASYRRAPCAVRCLLVVFLWALRIPPPAATGPLPPQTRAGAFVVAFKVSAESGFDMLWPHQAMPPASFRAVLMLIDRMPDARNEGNRMQDWQPMSAGTFLRVNGRAPIPLGTRLVWRDTKVPSAAFLVPLEGGRLRLSLAVPRSWRVHPTRNKVEVRLYQAKE